MENTNKCSTHTIYVNEMIKVFQNKDEKHKWIINFLFDNKVIKTKENLLNCEKAFRIYSFLSFYVDSYIAKKISKVDLENVFKVITKYINEDIDLFWHIPKGKNKSQLKIVKRGYDDSSNNKKEGTKKENTNR